MESGRVESEIPDHTGASPDGAGVGASGRAPTALEILLRSGSGSRPGRNRGDRSGGDLSGGQTAGDGGVGGQGMGVPLAEDQRGRAGLVAALAEFATPSGLRRLPRPVVFVAAVVLLGAMWAVWQVVQRPSPLEDRMPVAGTTGAGTTASVPSGSSPSPGGGAATGSESAPPTEIVVHVAGAVLRPGLAVMQPGDRVGDAVAAVGGFSADADRDRTNLAAVLVDGSWIAVPRKGEQAAVEVTTSVAPGVGAAAEGAGAVSGGGPGAGSGSAHVDINTATAEELEELPGVGPATAAAIVAHREQNGPFASVDGLLEVRGIGEAKLDAMRDMAVVGGA